MHPVRIGRIARALRRRLGWRQRDVARRAGVSQQVVSLVETGQCRRLSISTLEAILGCLEAEVELNVRWRGGAVDAVLDAAHAALVGATVRVFEQASWILRLEATYSIGRDRGSIDILAFEPGSRTLLVVEIKVDVTSADGTLRRHDEKTRLAARIARERFGWAAASVSGLLVLPDASTPRRRIAALAPLFERSYPVRGRAVRRWLRRPSGAIHGLLFLPGTKHVGDRRALASRRRVQRAREDAPDRGGRSMRPDAGGRFIDSSGEHQDDW